MSAQTGSGPMVLLSAEIPSQFLIELVRLYFTVIFLIAMAMCSNFTFYDIITNVSSFPFYMNRSNKFSFAAKKSILSFL